MNIKNVTEGEEVNKGCNIALGLPRIILQDVAILDLRERRDAAKKKGYISSPFTSARWGGELFAVFCS
jgi:hypothetical protein